MQSVENRVWAVQRPEHEGKQSVQKSGKCIVKGSRSEGAPDDLESLFVGFCAGQTVLHSILLTTRAQNGPEKHFVQRVGK